MNKIIAVFILIFISIYLSYCYGESKFKKGYLIALDYQCSKNKTCYMPLPGTLGYYDTHLLQHIIDLNVNIKIPSGIYK